MTQITDQLTPGDKIYYPSVKGMALLCEVIDQSDKDILVEIDGDNFYLPKKSVNSHAIIIDDKTAKSYITQRIEDPENKIVYLRYRWEDTWVDHWYNRYCERKNRSPEPQIIPASPKSIPKASYTVK